MKKALIVCLFGLMLLSFSACSGAEISSEVPPAETQTPIDFLWPRSFDNEPPNAIGNIIDAGGIEFVDEAGNIRSAADVLGHDPLFVVNGFVHGGIYEDEWIILCISRYPYSTIFVVWVTPDGERGESLEIPWQDAAPWIVGFDTTEEGHFQFLIRDREQRILHYVVYDRAGNLVFEPQVVLDLEAEGIRFISQVFFLPSGDIMISARMEAELNMLYIITQDGTLQSECSLFNGDWAMLYDGRVIAWASDGLMEFDPIVGRFGDEPLSNPDVMGISVYPAPAGSAFDLYMEYFRQEDSTWWIYGYHIDTGTLAPIMPWELVSLIGGPTGFQIIPLSDGRIAATRFIGGNMYGFFVLTSEKQASTIWYRKLPDTR